MKIKTFSYKNKVLWIMICFFVIPLFLLTTFVTYYYYTKSIIKYEELINSEFNNSCESLHQIFDNAYSRINFTLEYTELNRYLEIDQYIDVEQAIDYGNKISATLFALTTIEGDENLTIFTDNPNIYSMKSIQKVSFKSSLYADMPKSIEFSSAFETIEAPRYSEWVKWD